jgi:hypothetical protein
MAKATTASNLRRRGAQSLKSAKAPTKTGPLPNGDAAAATASPSLPRSWPTCRPCAS